ncbi:unnamed protein product [Heterobilharzia americana]|nr:unnamed protein product [Heterobilharzia americana]
MLLLIFCIFLSAHQVYSSSLTFELEDRSTHCFYEEVAKGSNFSFQFYVISGGNYDVDAELSDPHHKVIDLASRSSLHTFKITGSQKGAYRVCFSNSFSTVTHKVVSLMWINGSDNSQWTHVGAPSLDTTISISLNNIHSTIYNAVTQLFENRVLLTRSYSYAVSLNKRVLYWSLGQAIIIILFGIGQVIVMRSFFSSSSSKQFIKPIPTMPGSLHTTGF